jgi:transposase
VRDDYTDYKASFALGVTEAGCMAHARRKFVELQATNKSTIAGTAIDFIGQLYGIEREVKDLSPEQRQHERRIRSAPVARALHEWLIAQRTRITDGTATAKAIDYSLNRWGALTCNLQDPALPIDNNHDEQQIRTWATGGKNWLFAGTLLAGQRPAAIMRLIQSAKLNGHGLSQRRAHAAAHPPLIQHIDELLPHRWAAPPG